MGAMRKNALVNQIVAVSMLFFVLAWMLPAQWPHRSLMAMALVSAAVLLGFFLLADVIAWQAAGFLKLLLPLLSMLVAGIALQFLPRAASGWMAFLAAAILLAFVIKAQLDMIQGRQEAFVSSQILLTITPYALYMILAGALRFADWPAVISGLILFFVGGGFAVQILGLLLDRREAAAIGWLIAFITTQFSVALYFLPMSGVWVAGLTTGLFYALINFTAAAQEKVSWGLMVVRTLGWPLVWLLGLWWLTSL